MVKVFKTDVQSVVNANTIVNVLLNKYPTFRIHLDLEDEDKILRVEGTFFKAADIIHCLKEYGYICIDLPIDFCF
jgi:hypothetical protein